MSRDVTGTLVGAIFTPRSNHQQRRENSHNLGPRRGSWRACLATGLQREVMGTVIRCKR